MKYNKGFTLIELMIVIVIIGTIIAFALPNYQRQVIVSKRSEAKTTLMLIASAEERNNASYNQYTINMSAVVASATDLGLGGAQFHSSPDYTYTITNTVGYTIIATAKGSSTQDKDNFGVNCKILKLNSLGQKTPLDCWQ